MLRAACWMLAASLGNRVCPTPPRVTVGGTYRTPFEPSGTVKVLALEPTPEWPYNGRTMAYVEFVEDHPHGYPAGSTGRYLADELLPLVPDPVQCPPVQV